MTMFVFSFICIDIASKNLSISSGVLHVLVSFEHNAICIAIELKSLGSEGYPFTIIYCKSSSVT